MTYQITITEFNDDFVKYTFESGSSGMTGRKWFPGVAVGQKWNLTLDGALVKVCERV